MKLRSQVTFLVVALLALVTLAPAGDEAKTVTVSGKIACAKCTLKVADAKECQSILVVEGSQGTQPTHYYLVANEVAEEFGHACESETGAVVTGAVREKDGKLWLTASKMEQPKT